MIFSKVPRSRETSFSETTGYVIVIPFFQTSFTGGRPLAVCALFWWLFATLSVETLRRSASGKHSKWISGYKPNTDTMKQYKEMYK